MGEFGYKIRNYQAGSIYGLDIGVRDRYDFKDAMLTNSLFLDFLKQNGLQTHKEESTRDVICIEFNYGVHDYKDELASIKRRKRQAEKDHISGSLNDKEYTSYIAAMNVLQDRAEAVKDKFIKKTRGQLREEYYQNGVSITYDTHNKKGDVIKSETIHYKMLYRTPGKAKKGSCMFIRDELFDKARNFLYMGIQLPKENAPIVEIGAYSSLVTSTIINRIQIKPEEILILKDVDAYFNTKVISVELDENKHCVAIPKDNYQVKNTLFDGQALIDESIFPEWGEGYLLLRHHFCKMAAFKSDIQLFFQDYFGEQYEEAMVTDMWGNQKLAKNIKLITTDNALKWLKFDIDFDYWSEWVRKNDCMFGIVKTAHKSKFGDVQRMSYQMVNALDIDRMESICQCTVDYICKLKQNDEVFLDYLRRNQNFSNDFEVLVALVEHNPEFVRCDYYRARKKEIIRGYVSSVKGGKLIQNGDNLVIVGSPYAMLLHSVGEDVNKDDTFQIEEGTIQCYTERFEDGEYLAEFRSPFNSRNNLGYLHNHYSDRMKRYFNFGKQIIAINMIGTDAQDMNNGSDQDSDSLYVTNQVEVVSCAREFYRDYPTIVNNIPKEKNHYSSSLLDFARVDDNLMASQLAIGESSNLAQIALSYTFNKDSSELNDAVCILSVLAQCAIDNAKRKYDIDITEEIKLIKRKIDIPHNGYPSFWSVIRPEFKRAKNKSKLNRELKCPMNYIYRIKLPKYVPNNMLPMEHFFIKHEFDSDRSSLRKSKKVEQLIEKYSLRLLLASQSNETDNYDLMMILQEDFDKLIESIRTTYISNNYVGLISRLIDRAFRITPNFSRHSNANTSSNKALLLKTLYKVNSKAFLRCFKEK